MEWCNIEIFYGNHVVDIWNFLFYQISESQRDCRSHKYPAEKNLLGVVDGYKNVNISEDIL